MKGTCELLAPFFPKSLSLSPLPPFFSFQCLLIALLLHFVDIISRHSFCLDSSCCCFGTEDRDILAPWDTHISLLKECQLLPPRDLFMDVVFLPSFPCCFLIFVCHTLLIPQQLLLRWTGVEPCVCTVLFSSVGCCL
uniref:Uncharacterized protein n=1 Tax=Rhipicephalus microplus TaxID=6941 RepID=A0A6G5AIJ0_RHIMP